MRYILRCSRILGNFEHTQICRIIYTNIISNTTKKGIYNNNRKNAWMIHIYFGARHDLSIQPGTSKYRNNHYNIYKQRLKHLTIYHLAGYCIFGLNLNPLNIPLTNTFSLRADPENNNLPNVMKCHKINIILCLLS